MRHLPLGKSVVLAWPVIAHTRSFLGFVFIHALLACHGASPAPDTPASISPERVQPAMQPPSEHLSLEAPDPIVSDPDNYRLVMENDRVRVLRYHDVPGTKTHLHAHPDSVLYALSSFRRRLAFPDNTSKEREFQQGDVMWLPAQIHSGENIGTSDTEVLLLSLIHN